MVFPRLTEERVEREKDPHVFTPPTAPPARNALQDHEYGNSFSLNSRPVNLSLPPPRTPSREGRPSSICATPISSKPKRQLVAEALVEDLRKQLEETRGKLFAADSRVRETEQIIRSMDSERKKRKSYQMLNRSTKSARTAEALNYLIEVCGAEEDFPAFFHDLSLKVGKKYVVAENKGKMSSAEGLHCIRRFNISWKNLQNMKAFLIRNNYHDPFPSLRGVVADSKDLSWKNNYVVEEHLSEDLDPKSKVTSVYMVNIEKYLTERIENLLNSDSLSSETTDIKIGITGDKGGECTRFSLMVGDVEHPNSVANHTLIGSYNGSDTRENVLKYLEKMVSQINDLKTITVCEKTFNLELFLIGDYKFLLSMVGLKSASSKYPCLWCDKEKFNTVDKWLDHTLVGQPRTLDTCIHHGLTEEKGMNANSKPVFTNIKISNIIPPSLHSIALGISSIAFEELNSSAQKIDLGVNLKDEIDMKTIKKTRKQNESNINVLKERKQELETGKYRLEVVEAVYTSMIEKSVQPSNEPPCPANRLCLLRDDRAIKLVDPCAIPWVVCLSCNRYFHQMCCGLTTPDLTNMMLEKGVSCFDCSTPRSAEDRRALVQNDLNQTIELLTENVTLLEDAIKIQENFTKVFQKNCGAKMRELDNLFSELGADKSAYFQVFNGNQVHRLLKPENCVRLWSLFPEHPRQAQFIDYMISLSDLCQYTNIQILSQEKIDEFPRLVERMVSSLRLARPNQSVTPKLHLISAHVNDFIQQNKFWGRMSEQGIEALHARCHFLERKYQAVKGDEHLLSIANHLSYDNYYNDTNPFKHSKQ